jgi:phosphate transport system substrate-binding protein
VGKGNDLALKLDYATKEPGAYPINLVTYEIVCSKGKDAQKQQNIKAFLTYFASEEAQKAIEEIGYAPLPTEVQTKVETAIAAIS